MNPGGDHCENSNVDFNNGELLYGGWLVVLVFLISGKDDSDGW